MRHEYFEDYELMLLSLDKMLYSDYVYFIDFYHHAKPSTYSGYKYTITGNSVNDAVYLMDKLGQFLINLEIPFKVGTNRLYNCGDGEQEFKVLTIYVHNFMNAELLEEDIKHILRDYKGGEGIKLKWSEQINEYLYKRVDMDENGYYIPANEADKELYKDFKINEDYD